MENSLYGGIIELSPDGQPISPTIILAYRSGEKQGVIQNVQSFVQANHLNAAHEVSFDVHKGRGKDTCELWNSIKDFRFVYIPHLGDYDFNPWYELMVTVDEKDESVKHCHAIHVHESELSQLSLNELEINTESDISRDDYVPTILYNPENESASLLHRILKDKASHYSVFHVDSSLARLQRTFSWKGKTILDSLNEISQELECVFVYGITTEDDGMIHRTISAYDLNDFCLDCSGRNVVDGVCQDCGSDHIQHGYGEDTNIFLNSENFAENITYSSNTDKVKNCFRLVAGDDLMTATIRNINPSGTEYLWYLSDSLRADMSEQLRTKLAEYDELYNEYNSDLELNIPEESIEEYNILVDKYKDYDGTLSNCNYPIQGYSSLAELYYNALNLYSLLKTTLAPEYVIGKHTTAEEEILKLTGDNLSPLGVSSASTISSATVDSLLANYAKIYFDTSLYKLSIVESQYSNGVWQGKLKLTSYSDEEDSATTGTLTINVTDASAEYLRCQIEKAMKRNDVDASGTIDLLKMQNADFVAELEKYSVDNLNVLANVVRGCLDVLIQQGVATPDSDLYTPMYLPYFSKYEYIQEALTERESEISILRGTKDDPSGLLDLIEKERQDIADALNLRDYLGEILWAEFCSYRRDDVFQNSNFISDGLTDAELIARAKEFVQTAQREIIRSATLQHSISCNLSNFLLMREQDADSHVSPTFANDNTRISIHDGVFLVNTDSVFSPLLRKFKVGNWLHVEVDESVFKLRLTDYEINYDDLTVLKVDFSDIIYSGNSISDVRSILAKAQSMATSYNTVQRQANNGNVANSKISNMVANGLDLTNKKIVNSANNQTLLVDETGMLLRERNDFDDAYNAEQVKIINHGFYYTNDNWRTVQTALGKFMYFDPETGQYREDYGIIARKIVGNIILGNELGIYNTAGSVKINNDGVTITSDADDVNEDLFTIRRDNGDGTYTNYVYMDDEGNIKINGSYIEMRTGDDLETFVQETSKTESENLSIGSRNLLKQSDSIDGVSYYGAENSYEITLDTISGREVTKISLSSVSDPSKAIYYEIYFENLLTYGIGTELTVSMRVYASSNMNLGLCVADKSGADSITDLQDITLTQGWNDVRTILTIDNDLYSQTDYTSIVLRITDDLQSEDYYCINYIQLAVGNHPSYYYPAPEDTLNYTNESVNNLYRNIQDKITNVLDSVRTNTNDIALLNSESGPIAEIRRTGVVTQQQVDRVETNINTYIVQVDNVTNRIVAVEATTECFSMEDAGLRITRKTSGQSEAENLSMLLNEEKLSFYQGGREVAYFSNNKLYVTDAEILNRIQIGKYAFVPRSNGNLSFRYVG